jgi:hypothetical protein
MSDGADLGVASVPESRHCEPRSRSEDCTAVFGMEGAYNMKTKTSTGRSNPAASKLASRPGRASLRGCLPLDCCADARNDGGHSLACKEGLQ